MRDKEKVREYNRRRHEEAKPAYEALMSCYPFTLEDLDGEQWRPIDGFDKYQVSNYGRIKSFWGKTPIIRKPNLCREYLRVDLSINGDQSYFRVHVLVAKAFIPNPEDKPEVNHDDGNKFNCHVSNLYWATKSENVQHSYDTGLTPSGLENSRGKIKDEKDIIYIRENPDNLTQEQLAVMFGVTNVTISQIQLGKKYANVGGTIREKQKYGAYHRIPDEIRAQIRAERATGQYSFRTLAKKHGYGTMTIWRIINET